jgi:hypothetical protein
MGIATKHIGLADKFAVSASTICAVHCIGLPFLLSVFPAVGSTLFGEESFHVWLLWGLVPLSAFSLSLGCKNHRNFSVLLKGILGVCVLIFTALAGHEMLGESSERYTTLLGAGLLALAHLRNYKLCRLADCAQ